MPFDSELRFNLKSDSRFPDYYARHLKPLAERYEAERCKANKERNRRLLAALPVFIVFLILGINLISRGTSFGWWAGGFLTLVCAIMLGVWCWFPTLVHAIRLEEQILPRLVPFFGDLKIQWDRDLDLRQFAAWHALPGFDEARTTDVIEGHRQGVGLLFAEIALNRRVRRVGDTTSSMKQIFKGFMLALKPQQSFSGHTLIATPGLFKSVFHLEDTIDWQPQPVDDNLFEVYVGNTPQEDTTRGIEWITAESLRRLGMLRRRIGADRMLLSFHQDQVLIVAEHNEDYFELPTSKKTDFERDAQMVGEQLSNIFAFVDVLELSDKSQDDIPHTPQAPTESELQPDRPEVYNQRAWGWGCLPVFLVFAILILPFGLFLQNAGGTGDLSSADVAFALGVFVAFLSATGLYKIYACFKKRSIGALIFGLMLLAAAGGIVYAKVPERVKSLQSCFTGEQPIGECMTNLRHQIEEDN